MRSPERVMERGASPSSGDWRKNRVVPDFAMVRIESSREMPLDQEELRKERRNWYAFALCLFFVLLLLVESVTRLDRRLWVF